MSISELLLSIGNQNAFDPTEGHRDLRALARSVAEREFAPAADSRDEASTFDAALFRRLGSQSGLFGLTVPKEYGGAGLDALAPVIVSEELSAIDAGMALSYVAHEVLFVHNFFQGASREQMRRLLGPVIAGKWIAGIAMTEPDAGTDVLAMRTLAKSVPGGFRLSGTKQFVTNAGVGDIFIVYARTQESEKSITAFVVETSKPGVTFGRLEKKLGMRSSPTGQLLLDEAFVPAENVLGEVGRGLTHMMRNLEIERVALAAQSLGIARRCLEIGATYAIAERRQFGQPIASFGQIQRLLGEGLAQYEAARALVYSVGSQITFQTRSSAGSAAAKLVASQMGEYVSRSILQVLGGYGYCRDYQVERFFRDAVLLSIGGGTNEALQKNLVKDMAKALAPA